MQDTFKQLMLCHINDVMPFLAAFATTISQLKQSLNIDFYFNQGA